MAERARRGKVDVKDGPWQSSSTGVGSGGSRSFASGCRPVVLVAADGVSIADGVIDVPSTLLSSTFASSAWMTRSLGGRHELL